MRIAHYLLGRCSPDSASGVDKMIHHQSVALALSGHTVAVMSETDKKPHPIEGVEVFAYPAGPARSLRPPAALAADLVAWRPDVVHLHSVLSPRNNALGAVLSRAGVPYVVSPHGALMPSALRHRAYSKIPYVLLRDRALLRDAAFVHALTAAEAKSVQRWSPRASVEVIPNGVAPWTPTGRDASAWLADRLAPAARAEGDPATPDLSASERIVLFLGRLDIRRKGLDLLVGALGALGALDRAALSRVRLVVAGPDPGTSTRDLGRSADHLGVADRFTWWGPVFGEERRLLMEAADIFVLPSRAEGFPLAMLEAASCGKPCLVTDGADPDRFVARSDCGVTVEASADALARGLSSLLDAHAETLRIMGERAREAVAREYDWGVVAGRFSAAYEGAEQRTGRRAGTRPKSRAGPSA